MLIKCKRKIIQFLIFIIYNFKIQNFALKKIDTSILKTICIPGLNCYSCPSAVFSCPIGSLQLILNKKYGSFFSKIPMYVIGFMMLFGLIFGRMVCGFLCPFGFIQELLYKIKTKKIIKNKFIKKLSIIKYFVLIFFVIVFPIFFFNPSFCKYICPSGTLFAGIPNIILHPEFRKNLGYIFSIKLTLLILILIFSVFVFRFFCKVFCPLGAFYSFFNHIAIFGLNVDKSKCVNCMKCTRNCLMDVDYVSDKNCILCLDCKKNCKSSAIYFNFEKFNNNYLKNNVIK